MDRQTDHLHISVFSFLRNKECPEFSAAARNSVLIAPSCSLLPNHYIKLAIPSHTHEIINIYFIQHYGYKYRHGNHTRALFVRIRCQRCNYQLTHIHQNPLHHCVIATALPVLHSSVVWRLFCLLHEIEMAGTVSREMSFLASWRQLL
jgi:hypothetical protein